MFSQEDRRFAVEESDDIRLFVPDVDLRGWTEHSPFHPVTKRFSRNGYILEQHFHLNNWTIKNPDGDVIRNIKPTNLTEDEVMSWATAVVHSELNPPKKTVNDRPQTRNASAGDDDHIYDEYGYDYCEYDF